MKPQQFHLGFELKLPIQISMTVAISLSASPNFFKAGKIFYVFYVFKAK